MVIARKDPPVSEAQRRAMWAAKSGHSNIGIPQSVGKEFAEADPGGKLPEKKRSDSDPSKLPEGGSRTRGGYPGGTLPKMDATPPPIPPGSSGGTKTPAMFDRHDIKGYMDSVKRGDAEGMKVRSDAWRK